MSTEKGPYYLMKHCDYRKEAAFFGVLVMVGDSPAIDRPMNQFDAQASMDALNAAYVKGYAAGQEAAPPPSGAVADDRNAECVKAWPECEPMAFDPRCCRFPKSCSCTSGSIAALDPTSGAVVEEIVAKQAEYEEPDWVKAIADKHLGTDL